MAPKRLRLTAPDDANQLRNAADYEARLDGLQLRLVQIQQTFMRGNERAIVVLEGWDAAGKGGLIRRLNARLDPRFLKVIPIAEPKPEEQGRHYLYRFWQGLPVPGTITVFDRSWYGRVLVERVEKLIPPAAWKRAYAEINEFEAMLLDDGIRLVKLFLHVSAEEQLRRFKDRLETPHKRWKLTMSDLRNLERRSEYERAVNEMLAHCHTKDAPWDVIASDYKWWSRCQAMSRIVAVLGRGLTIAPPPPDPKIAKRLRSLRKKVRATRA